MFRLSRMLRREAESFERSLGRDFGFLLVISFLGYRHIFLNSIEGITVGVKIGLSLVLTLIVLVLAARTLRLVASFVFGRRRLATLGVFFGRSVSRVDMFAFGLGRDWRQRGRGAVMIMF